uniref:Uncharacterized protein n=1 Tax=Molossus molossus TaxID=27622 RepID=A0A7J8HH01_MOLMO|nr:hypothetical protein HJG59_011003 [Molossus molossus]
MLPHWTTLSTHLCHSGFRDLKTFPPYWLFRNNSKKVMDLLLKAMRARIPRETHPSLLNAEQEASEAQEALAGIEHWVWFHKMLLNGLLQTSVQCQRKWKGTSGQDGDVGKSGIASSHNHIKVTTKLHNNHHSKLPEIELSGSPTTAELKKQPHQDWPEGSGKKYSE